MDSNPNTPQKVYKSSEIIQAVLDALGLQRTNSSEYVTYTADGKVLRVRVSDHGVNLSAWYRNNEGEVIPLSNSDNIAFTFLPNRDECKTLNIKFPPKVINKTPVYSDLKTKTPIDYEFTVMHYVYSSWKFTEEYLNLLTNAIVNYTTSGKFNDPLANTSAKAVLFNDTSNKKPQKIKQNTSEIKTENKQYNKNRNMKQTIKLRESELKRMIAESVKRVLRESIDSVSPDPYGTDADSYHTPTQDDDTFLNKHCPWRQNSDCSTVEGMVEWGLYNSRRFENGELSIRNYFGDLNRMVNGY